MNESKRARIMQAATQEIALALTREAEAKKLITALAMHCGPLRVPADPALDPPKGSAFRLYADEVTREWVIEYMTPEAVTAARKAEAERRTAEGPRIAVPAPPQVRLMTPEELRAAVLRDSPGAHGEYTRRSLVEPEDRGAMPA